MSLRGRFRKLFRAQSRRRNISPRVVELLEQRVLLTDIVYYDVLKGQNFSQTGTGNPVLQGGSPFRLHSSVHAQADLTAATLGVPDNSTKTLDSQSSSQNRSFDQPFTTKSALDNAFAAGNYTFTISHLMDINFSPSLDVSAGVNQQLGNIVFSGQVFEPNVAGTFQETWSPSTPAINVVNGTINATDVTADLVGVNNADATGTINATWNGSQYAGTYSFNGQNGNVTIPEGYKSTLNLPADAYPNAPHITNFTAAQAVNPAADFTFTWDAFAGGTTDDLITLFIFDGNNQVFHTDAIPLPSDSPHLDGTATSFTLPKNTLLANKSYQAQLWFQNFTTLDTMSFPGATGAAGFYAATNFTIKTGAAVDTTPPDVVAYYVTKAQEFVQAGPGTPVLSEDSPFFFAAFVEERDEVGSTVNEATVTPPTNIEFVGPQDLFANDEGGWDFFNEFDTKAELDAAFKTGKYTFAIDTVNQGLKSPTVTLPSESYPVTPHVSNWTDAQLIDANSGFTLTWDAFTGGTTGDFIQVSIVNSFDETIFETPGFWESNPLLGTARSVVIPAETLNPGEEYTATLLFANASALNRTTYKNAIGTTAYSKLTSFTLQTIPPEGVLQFESANFSVNENADPAIATIMVTRIGGSQGEVEIEYSTSDDSANDTFDYTSVTGTLTLGDGETSQTFEIPILDDDQSEGHETVTLHLMNPTNGAILGTRATATLTILDNELTFGPGNFIDGDGDKYAIKLTGPGTALIALDDPDGDGRGSIKAILLSNTTSTSALSVTVTKVTGGDGEVSIGRVAGSGPLKSFIAAKSDLIGDGLSFDSAIGQITVDDVLNGADIVVGGTLANTTTLTLGEVAAGTELRSGATISSLTAQTFLGDMIQAPAITALTVNTGSFPTDLDVDNAIKALTVKTGGAMGDWTAASFGTVSVTGGNFAARLRATATSNQLGTSPAISSLTVAGGNLTGAIHALGKLNAVKVLKNAANQGGSITNAILAAKSIDSITADRDVLNSHILAGANLGDDFALGGSAGDADQFGIGTLGAVTVRGMMTASVIGAGFDPLDGLINNENDAVIGGNASEIKTLTVTGLVSSDSFFPAGRISGAVKFNNVTIAPANDSRFFLGGGATVLERTRARVTAAGGIVNLPGGSRVEIPDGFLDDDRIATLTRVSDMPTLPLSGIFTDVGSSLSLSFSDASSSTLAADAAEASSPLETLRFVLKLGTAAIAGLSGSIAAANVATAAAGDHFSAVSSQVSDSETQTFEIDLPVSRVNAVTANNAEATYRVGMTNLINQLVRPAQPHVYWDGKTFKDFPSIGLPGGLPANFLTNGRTLVLVHGMASSVSGAYQDCVNDYKKRYGYDLVVGFNYDWTEGIEESGGAFAAFLKRLQSRGIQNVDIVSHSEGVPVALSGAGRTDISNIGIGKLVGLGGPVMGTPAATEGLLVGTILMHLLNSPKKNEVLNSLSQVGAATISDVLSRDFIHDLQLNSPVLQTIRDRFEQNRSGTELGLLAGTDASQSSLMSKLALLTGPVFDLLGQVNDGIIGRPSVLAEDWHPSTGLKITRLGSVPLGHDQLQCGDHESGNDRPLVLVSDFLNPQPAKVLVSPTKGLLTTEGGGETTFSMTLTSRPSSPVRVSLVSLDPSEGIANPLSFDFTADDWADPHVVTVEGQDDDIADGNQIYTIQIGPAVSDDFRYSGQNPDDVTITNLDDDRFLSINDVTKNEGHSGTTTFTFTVTLANSSGGSVGVDYSVTGGSATAGSDYTAIAPQRLTFSAGQTSKTISVSVKGDRIAESDETFFVNLSNASVGSQITDDQGIGMILNDDFAGIIVTPTAGLVTTESGGSAKFTIKLGSQPTADVTINLSSDNTAEGTVSPTSVTFTPTNWSTAKTITVKGVNDSLIDGDVVYHIVMDAAISADPNYSGRDASDVTVTNRDNDSSQPVPLAGTWSGSADETDQFLTYRGTMTLVLNLSGTLVTGTISLNLNLVQNNTGGSAPAKRTGTANLVGSLTGNHLVFTVPGSTFSVDAIITGNTMNGTLAVPSGGVNTTGTLNLTKR